MKAQGNLNVLVAGCVSGMVHGAAVVVFAPVLSAIFLGQAGPLQRSTESLMMVAAAAPVAWATVGFGLGAFMAMVHNVLFAAFVTPQTRKVKEIATAHAAGQQAA
jgi:hypothetical protein